MKKANIVIFVIILFFLGYVSAFQFNRGVISYTENRRLADFPKLTGENYWSGDYTAGIEAFLTDHFPRRDSLIELTQSISAFRGIQSADDLMIVTTSGANEGEATVEREETPQVSSKFVNDDYHFPGEIDMLIPVRRDPNVDVEKVEFDESFKTNILIYDQKAMTSFSYHTHYINYMARAYNRLHAIYPSVEMYAVMAPSPVAFVKESYERYTDDQNQGISDFYNQLDDSIHKVKLYPVMKRHLKEPIYFNTDHHWTDLGAYYAYEEVAKMMGLSPKGLKQFKKETYASFLGSLYELSQSPVLKDNEDVLTVYEPRATLEYTIVGQEDKVYQTLISQEAFNAEGYEVFLGGDHGLALIDNLGETETDETLLVLKDSYGNALVPYFVNHFKRIVIYDPRYSKETLGDLISQYAVDKLMIVNSGQALTSPSNISLFQELK